MKVNALVRFSFAAALTAVVIAPPSAGAAVGAPFDVSGGGTQPALFSQVAVDPDGDAVFTWHRRTDGLTWRIQTRARSAAGVLSDIQNLSPATANALNPQVGVDDSGNAVFVWHQVSGEDSLIKIRARSAAGVLGATQTLSAPREDAFGPQIGVDADGDAVVTWYRSDGTNQRVQSRGRSASGALGVIQTLSAAGEDVIHPQIAVAPAGHAIITWSRSDGANLRVQSRHRYPSGFLDPVRTLSAAGENAINPRVAVDDDGEPVFTWARSDGTHARAQGSRGGRSAVHTLSAAGQHVAWPDVDVDSNGDAVFSWQRSTGSHWRIQTRALSVGGVLTAVQNLSASGEGAAGARVAVDDAGDAVFSWHLYDEFMFVGTQARSRSAAGVLSAVQTLASGSDVGNSRVDTDSNGDAVFTWTNAGVIQGAAGQP